MNEQRSEIMTFITKDDLNNLNIKHLIEYAKFLTKNVNYNIKVLTKITYFE